MWCIPFRTELLTLPIPSAKWPKSELHHTSSSIPLLQGFRVCLERFAICDPVILSAIYNWHFFCQTDVNFFKEIKWYTRWTFSVPTWLLAAVAYAAWNSQKSWWLPRWTSRKTKKKTVKRAAHFGGESSMNLFMLVCAEFRHWHASPVLYSGSAYFRCL